MASRAEIYSGFWFDRSESSVITGATLTLPTRHATFLITFLALLVTACASFFWTITAFILHQFVSGGQQRDILDQQRQVVLRNSGTATEALWDAVRLLLAWRSRRPRRLRRRIAVLALPALLVWAFFSTAGILVAEIASKDYKHVSSLLKASDCGFFSPTQTSSETSSEASRAFTQKHIDYAIKARQYAKAWYGPNSSLLAGQALFPTTRLPYRMSHDAPCPWPGQCTIRSETAFSLQTDLLDSHIAFGINAPREQRVNWQKNVTCSVLAIPEANIETQNDTFLTHTNGDPIWQLFFFGGFGVNLSAPTHTYFVPLSRGSNDYDLQ
jgi:hypothetical protein